MPENQKPGVVFQPVTYERMQYGFSQLVKAIRPTLGPYPHLTVSERAFRSKMPELLDDGATIARRIIQLKDRDADVGAMFLRHVLWEVRDYVGDGTATTAVLFDSIFQQGVRYVTAGGNAMRLRHYLDQGMRVILDELAGMTMPIRGRKRLAELAMTVCSDEDMALALGEMVDILGECGRLEIAEDYGRGVRKEYVEGAFWPNAMVESEYETKPGNQKIEITEPAILITDLDVNNPQPLVTFVEACVRAGERKLVLFAGDYSNDAISLIRSANRDPAKFQLLALKLPGLNPDDIAHNMEDLVILTGGRPRIKAAGDTLEGFRSEHLGHARQVWVNKDYFGIIHGQGEPIEQRAYTTRLKSAYLNSTNKEERRRLLKRIGIFHNGSANLFVGGVNQIECDRRKELAGRTLDMLRGALRDGVVPGGGVALFACKSALQARCSTTTEPEEYAAYRILAKAMEAPMRTLLTNAGYDDSEVIAGLKLTTAGTGFDVISGNLVNVVEAGIVDVASVVKAAVRAAASSAGLALTTDVLIHRKKLVEATEP